MNENDNLELYIRLADLAEKAPACLDLDVEAFLREMGYEPTPAMVMILEGIWQEIRDFK